MENNTNKLGRIGEAKAKAFLENKGYSVLESNWRSGKLEIDIIAQNQNTLVFIEVKLRNNNDFGEPEFFVNPKKQNFIIRAANAYIEEKQIELESRFDIISLNIEKAELIHLEGAFFPTLSKPL